jgi:hypothetical protein
MKLFQKGILRTLALTGIVAAAGAAAQAQVAVGVQFGTPAAYNEYVPACPGVGFIWTPGYYTGGIWIAGRWEHRGGPVFVGHDYRDTHFDHRDYHFDHRGWDHGRR